MGECTEDHSNKKRSREGCDDSVGVHSPESKLARVDSVNSVDENEFAHESNADATKDSPVVMRIQNDLLDIFDDSEPDPAIQGLDSVIRSFEEEILYPDQAPPAVMTSDSGESRPDLGYLLEASDDELGLPPSFSSVGIEEQKIEDVGLGSGESGPGPVSLDDIALGFDEIANFEPYKFGVGGELDNTVANDFITFGGGLFDSYEPADVLDFLWRSESLSAS